MFCFVDISFFYSVPMFSLKALSTPQKQHLKSRRVVVFSAIITHKHNTHTPMRRIKHTNIVLVKKKQELFIIMMIILFMKCYICVI